MAININLNGPAVRGFISHAQAVANGMTHTAKYSVERYIEDWYYLGHYGDPAHKTTLSAINGALTTAIWSDTAFSLRYPLENGTYNVKLIMGENNKDYAKNFEIAVEGQTVVTVPRMRKGEFAIFSRNVTVSDGQLFLAVRPIGDSEVHLMGIALSKQ